MNLKDTINALYQKVVFTDNNNFNINELEEKIVSFVVTSNDLNEIHQVLMWFVTIKKNQRKSKKIIGESDFLNIDKDIKLSNIYQSDEAFLVSNALTKNKKRYEVIVEENKRYLTKNINNHKFVIDGKGSYYIKLKNRYLKLYDANHRLLLKQRFRKLMANDESKESIFKMTYNKDTKKLDIKDKKTLKHLLTMQFYFEGNSPYITAKCHSSYHDKELIYLVALGITKLLTPIATIGVDNSGYFVLDFIFQLLAAIIDGII